MSLRSSIPQSFVHSLLSKIDLIEIISEDLNLKKTGSNYSACCPFHNEKSPSFIVFPKNQNYHCFGCGAHGDAISYIRESKQLGYVETIKFLSGLAGLEVPTVDNKNYEDYSKYYQLLAELADFYTKQLYTNPKKSVAIDYLKARGLTGQIAKSYGLGFCPDAWDFMLKNFCQNSSDKKAMLLELGLLVQKNENKVYDRFRGRIIFPIRNSRNKVIGFGGRAIAPNTMPKYLNSSESKIYKKSYEVYGLYEARLNTNNLKSLIVVEGYMDVIGLAQFGVTNVVATLGTAVTSSHLKILLNNVKSIIFCFDGDNAGYNAALKTLEKVFAIMEDGIDFKYLFIPKGYDPDSFIREKGKDEFLKRAHNAMPLSEFFLKTIKRDLPDNSIDSKAKLLYLAKPYLKQLPKDGVFAKMLINQLAIELNLEANSVFASIEGIEVATKPQAAKPTNVQKKPEPKTSVALLLKTIAIFAKRPNFAKDFTSLEWLKDLKLEHITLFLHSLEFIKKNNFISTEDELYNFLNAKLELKQIKQAANALLLETLETEITAIKHKLEQIWHKQQLEELINLARFRQLSAEEKVQLQQLLVE